MTASCSRERDNPWDQNGANPHARDRGVADLPRDGLLADSAIPDMAVPDHPGLDLPAPDLLALDLSTGDQTPLDMALSDLPLPDIALPDQATPDQALPDKALSDKMLPDQMLLDQTLPDQMQPDQMQPDQMQPDQMLPDVGITTPLAWVTIKAGFFQMGTPISEPCRLSGETLHKVTLSRDFELSRTEVTQGQFKDLMGYNGSVFTTCGLNCPVENVRWREAAAFCNALSAKAGYTTCYSCTGTGANVNCQVASGYGGKNIYGCPGYRLPAEAEWEYAYRAKTSTAYYSGAGSSALCYSCTIKEPSADSIGWYCYNAGGKTHVSGQKLANAWGLYDMPGSVWEWCHDGAPTNFGTSPVTDPVGNGVYKVIRGGSIHSSADDLRGARRFMDSSTSRNSSTGFRCARTIKP